MHEISILADVIMSNLFILMTEGHKNEIWLAFYGIILLSTEVCVCTCMYMYINITCKDFYLEPSHTHQHILMQCALILPVHVASYVYMHTVHAISGEVPCGCSEHVGRTIINDVYSCDVETMFKLIFTDSDFMRNFYKLENATSE